MLRKSMMLCRYGVINYYNKYTCGGLVWFVGSLKSLCHSNGHIETTTCGGKYDFI